MYLNVIFTSKFTDKMFSFFHVIEDLTSAQQYLKDATQKFSSKNVKNYATHIIFLDEKGEDALRNYDAYFSDTEFSDTIENFIDKILDQQTITSVDIASHLETKIKTPVFKLVKTVYYIYADLLVENGVRPFKSNLEAWPYGPVDRDVYREKKHHAKELSNLDKLLLKVDSSNIDFLDKVDALHRKYKDSFNQLDDNPTHRNGTPWHTVCDSKFPKMDPKINDTNILMHHKMELI